MWMRLSLLLAALLAWDMATADDGNSAFERSGRALMAFEPVRELVGYVESGDFLDDMKSLTSVVSAEGVALVASRNVAEQQRTDRQRAERREAREERRTEVHLSQEDVDAIAKAVKDLYAAEREAADEEKPTSLVLPEPEEVERSMAELGPDLLSAIVAASRATGANSGYLLHIALRESGLALTAQAPTSSATGPFQFIQQTWYEMLGRYGPKHGLEAEAALLARQSNGRFAPVSNAARNEVLALRTDAHIAALMAGELTMENKEALEDLLGRTPAHGELYAAHVFGPAGAAQLIKTRDTAAATSAASLMPSAAAANRWLFYSPNGVARSVAALFDELSRFMSTREVAQVCDASLNFFGT
ncbi:MAG: hypothetical protein WD671_11295 [Parvibaculum sp.]